MLHIYCVLLFKCILQHAKLCAFCIFRTTHNAINRLDCFGLSSPVINHDFNLDKGRRLSRLL